MKKNKLMVLLISLLVITGVSAALIEHFGLITQEIDVKQAIVLEGDSEIGIIASGGESVVSDEEYTIVSQTSVSVPVTMTSEVVPDSEGIGTFYVKELTLDNKNPTTWIAISDDRIATLYYSFIGEKLGYNLVGQGLEATTMYSLIYYADKPDRFVNWGGNNPGALLGEGITGSDGKLVMSGSLDIEMSLPHENDANKEELDYCESPDFYKNCHGAKIWLVPSSEYDAETATVITWNPTAWLFETDLVTYENSNNFVVSPEQSIKFKILNVFDTTVAAGTYTVTTTVNPE